MSQKIRPSQYITTFGPGAIIETPSGPHLLKSFDQVISTLENSTQSLDPYEITDMRLSRGLLGGARILRLPDENALPRFEHPTDQFPKWNLCVKNHNVNDRNLNIIYKRSEGCPLCKGEDKKDSASNKNAIRFVMACPNGHLSDVSWDFLIHLGNEGPRCNSKYFLWHGSGSSMSTIRIQCPDCRTSKSLGEIYNSDLKCSGFTAEGIFQPNPPQCNERAIVLQRGSSQIRYPDVITSLTIPPYRPIHRLLENKFVLYNLKRQLKVDNPTLQGFAAELDEMQNQQIINPDQKKEILNYSWDEIKDAFHEIESRIVEKSLKDYLIQEHKAFEYSSKYGYPTEPPPNERRINEPPRFEVIGSQIQQKIVTPFCNLKFRVVPINRLRTVLVQKSYRRVNFENDQNAKNIKGRDSKGDDWYPGVEHFGEGVFIELNEDNVENRFYPKGERAELWDNFLQTQNSNVSSQNLIEWNSLAIWWHTLSHRLINSISIHSGYSSTAIRERVYCSSDPTRGTRGAILLYTTQSGGDGTTGGLTSLTPNFVEIFRLSLETIDTCSNDPLCFESEKMTDSKIGAACYSCAMLSETSCEHMNTFLDRRLLLENLA